MSAAKSTLPYGAVLLVAAIALIGAGAARANEQIHVGKAQGTAWTFLPVDIGIAQGFFAKLGLDIDSADLGGDAKVQQALASGSIDIGLGSGPGLAFVAKGSPAIGVAAFAGPPRNISAIVLEDSPIKTIADLKGKLIAVSSVGSLSDWLAKQMAIQEGWGQDGIRAVPLGAVEISIAALKAKQVDAVVLSTEAGFGLEERKQGRMLASMDRYAPHFITHVVFAQEILGRQQARYGAAFPQRLLCGESRSCEKPIAEVRNLRRWPSACCIRARRWSARITISRPGCSSTTAASMRRRWRR